MTYPRVVPPPPPEAPLYAGSGGVFIPCSDTLTCPGDPTFSNVSLLLNMNGTNGSVTFTDSSTNGFTVTPTNATISTTQSKFGGASGSFTGTLSRLNIATNAAFGLGSGDFTVDGWLYASTLSGDKCIFDNRTASAQGIGIYASGSATNQAFRLSYTNNTATLSPPDSKQFTANTWQHWRVARKGGLVMGFIDMELVWAVPDRRSLPTSSPVVIGDAYSTAFAQAYPGYLDEIRVVKGEALVPDNCNALTAAFPNS